MAGWGPSFLSCWGAVLGSPGFTRPIPPPAFCRDKASMLISVAMVVTKGHSICPHPLHPRAGGGVSCFPSCKARHLVCKPVPGSDHDRYEWLFLGTI
jgi:hypothetical protein